MWDDLNAELAEMFNELTATELSAGEVYGENEYGNRSPCGYVVVRDPRLATRGDFRVWHVPSDDIDEIELVARLVRAPKARRQKPVKSRDAMIAMLSDGAPIRMVARVTGFSRNTVRRAQRGFGDRASR